MDIKLILTALLVLILSSENSYAESLDIKASRIQSLKIQETENWLYQWDIKLSPEDVNGSNSFEIVSQLQTLPHQIESKNLPDDLGLLGAVLIEKKIFSSIKPPNGLDLRFFLNKSIDVNPNGPIAYPYLNLSSGFFRAGDFDPKVGLKPYATSFPIYTLGNTLVEIIPADKGGFSKNSVILLATIKTKDSFNSYSYIIYLVKYPLKN